MLPQIDLALAAGTVTLPVLLAALLFRDVRTVAAGRLAVAFALGSAAHALTATSGFAPPVTPWHAVLIAVSTGNVVVFWLFARALFDDGFEVRRWHAAPWAAVVVLSLINCLGLVLARALDPRLFQRVERCRSKAARCLDAPDVRRPHLPPRGHDHRNAGNQARGARVQIAALDQPAAWVPKFQCLPQQSPDRGGEGRFGGPLAGRGARDHHCDGCGLSVARAVQSRLQGDHRRHADRIPPSQRGSRLTT